MCYPDILIIHNQMIQRQAHTENDYQVIIRIFFLNINQESPFKLTNNELD